MGAYVLCRYCGSFFDTDENEPASCSFHSTLPVLIGDTGARDDYADIWTFPCCGESVKADIVEGRDAKPEQTPGCTVGRHVRETGWDVFISYARPDERKAVTIENELRRRGHRAWRDRSDITPGAAWADTIDRAIAGADHVILVMTLRAIASAQVNRELDLALNAGKNLVPILFEECTIPERIQHINCVDWRSIDFGPVFFATNGFYQLRQAVIFGSPVSLWVRMEDAEPSQERGDRREPPPTTRQSVLLKDADGELVAEIQPRKPYEWLQGHLASVDGVIYVVVDVLQHSRSSIEVRVQRARVPVDPTTARPDAQQ